MKENKKKWFIFDKKSMVYSLEEGVWKEATEEEMELINFLNNNKDE